MSEVKIGDIVARKSHGYDIFFKVADIRKDGDENIVTLKGIADRIEADAPESDLVVQSGQRVNEYKSRCQFCKLASQGFNRCTGPCIYL